MTMSLRKISLPTLLWVAVPLALLGTAFGLLVQWVVLNSWLGDAQRLHNVEACIEHLPGASYDSNGFARTGLTAPGSECQAGGWRAVTLPAYRRLPASVSLHEPQVNRLWIRAKIPINPNETDDEIVVYVVRAMGGALALRINGQPVHLNFNAWRMQWNQPLLISVPRHLIHPGQPLVAELGLPFLAEQGYSMGSVYAGTRKALQPAHDLRVFFQRTLPQVSMIVIVIMGVLSAQFWLTRRNQVEHLMSAALSLAWLACNSQYFFDFEHDAAASKLFGALVDSAVAWVMVLMTMLILRFERAAFPRVELMLMSYALGVTLITLPWWGWNANALVLQHSFDVLIGVLMCLFVVWRAWVARRGDILVLVLSIWAMLLLGAYDTFGVTSQANPDAIHLFPYATMLVFLSVTYAIHRQHLGALQTSDHLRSTLSTELAAQRQAYELEMQRLTATELLNLRKQERERLRLGLQVRLSSQLNSVLKAVESGEIDSKPLNQQLKACFNEARMLIESLEPMFGDVENLMGAMRPRFEMKLKQQGAALVWDLGLVKGLPWLEASHGLLILRWVDLAADRLLSSARVKKITLSTRDLPAGVELRLSGQADGIVADASARMGKTVDLRAWVEVVEGLRCIGAMSKPADWGGIDAEISLMLPLTPSPIDAAGSGDNHGLSTHRQGADV
jgi:hypothetical protein